MALVGQVGGGGLMLMPENDPFRGKTVPLNGDVDAGAALAFVVEASSEGLTHIGFHSSGHLVVRGQGFNFGSQEAADALALLMMKSWKEE